MKGETRVWQYMGNSPEGAEAFRGLVPDWKKDGEVCRMPDLLRTNETYQRRIFAEIAGVTMDTNECRGLPFTWIPTHLGDAAGVATLRSFLVALRVAAEETPSSAVHALDWKSIHSGVRKLSTFRVLELAEDFL
jgi:hypothetical protein